MSDEATGTDAALEDYFAALSERAGTPPLGPDEADAVLDLARVVAHTSERRYAPLAAYVVGLAAGMSEAPLDPVARTAKIVEITKIAARFDGTGTWDDG